MISLKLNGITKGLTPDPLIARLMLHHHEVFHLPVAGQSLKVVSGVAWVTVNGRDIFLAPGEKHWLPSQGDAALVSALGRQPLILEVFGAVLPKEGGGIYRL